jgi:8-oxo-dGTP diphosphatase
MQQPITGFHQDTEGHWVADLACGHGQHVRHDPPWQVREWVLDEATRREHLGASLNCVLCDAGAAATDTAPPRVGVAVIVRRGDYVLLGHRLSQSHGAGTWQFPGGHLEAFEAVEACAAREVEEETGLRITDIVLGPFTNDLFDDEHRHYVTLFVLATAPHGEPRLLEPAKCAEWRWVDWDAMPEPLFLPIRNLKGQGFRP